MSENVVDPFLSMATLEQISAELGRRSEAAVLAILLKGKTPDESSRVLFRHSGGMARAIGLAHMFEAEHLRKFAESETTDYEGD